MVGALPLFIKYGKFGPVINSLPFFGSHGGLLQNNEDDHNVSQAIHKELDRIINELKALSCTLISSPLQKNLSFYESFNFNFHDERIGQITSLITGLDKEQVKQDLKKMCHQKTRNMINKAEGIEFKISHSSSNKNFKTLHKIHEELNKILIREKRVELYKNCLKFLKTRVELDLALFKDDIWAH